MYCTCDLNNQWFQRVPNQNMQTTPANCTESTTAHQLNGPSILKSCLSSNSHSYLPNILSTSQNHLHCPCSHLPQPQQQPHSQNVTPWRYYCTCKNNCYYCYNSFWPTCPRLTHSQSKINCYPGNCFKQQQQPPPPLTHRQSKQSLHKETMLNMSNGNCGSPTMSTSPVPAPPPQPLTRLNSASVCSRCRFAVPDNHTHNSQTAANYGNLSSSYTGKWNYIFNKKKGLRFMIRAYLSTFKIRILNIYCL